MTEPDVVQVVKEILGHESSTSSPVFTVARWITVRNNTETKEKKKRFFHQLGPYASCLLEFTLQTIQLCVKTVGADISSVTFPEFFT